MLHIQDAIQGWHGYGGPATILCMSHGVWARPVSVFRSSRIVSFSIQIVSNKSRLLVVHHNVMWASIIYNQACMPSFVNWVRSQVGKCVQCETCLIQSSVSWRHAALWCYLRPATHYICVRSYFKRCLSMTTAYLLYSQPNMCSSPDKTSHNHCMSTPNERSK